MRARQAFFALALAGCLAAFGAQAQEAEAIPPADDFSHTAAPESDSDLSLDRIEALLPAHLRTPLPVPGTDAPHAAAPKTPETPPSAAPPSAMERFYRDASGDAALTQYGYDFLTPARAGEQAVPAGTVLDDYLLGAGDQISVSFLGERKDHKSYSVDQSGTLAIDLLPPLAASGKSLAALKDDLRKLLDAQGYHGDVFVSLDHVRQMGVLVAGHVALPGRQTLTPLQTALEALALAGGITKDGSLRQIRLVRAGKTTLIDLYPVLAGMGASQTLPPLQEGDRIIVPALGPTMAVTGDVRQSGIYELPAQGSVSALEALALAGGALARGQNRVTLLTPLRDGRRTAQVVGMDASVRIGDGAIITINRTDDRAAASFTLSGETRSPGTYPLAQYRRLSAILRSSQAFGDDVYPLLGVVSRRMENGLARDLVAFSPQDIFTGAADLTLREGDSVVLFSNADVRAIVGNQEPVHEGISPLASTFVREHLVRVQGAVRMTGDWPVAGPLPVRRLLDVAGGTLRDADLTHAEINRNTIGLADADAGDISHRDIVDLKDAGAEGVTVTFGDAVRIPDRFEAVTRQSVTIGGEVRNPGTYDLMRGDTLAVLIDRAGGLTDQAYPPGTVFSRATERRREKERFNIAARDLERAIATAANNKDGKVDTEQMSLAKNLVEELKTVEPAGRITVEADPAVLRREPAQDILLESGDHVYVPKRPLSVRVSGEVLSPAALQFRADKDVGDYIAEAGGTTRNADKGRMFVLNPDGSAQPLSAGSWSRVKPLMITPGSTIVVPRDPKPFDFMESAKDITQILSNLAITGIYAEDLVDRN